MLSPRTHSNLPAVIGGGVAGLVAVGASLDAFGEYSSAAFGAVGVAAVITLVRGAFLMPKGARHPWVMLAIAVFLVMVAAALRDSYHTVGDLTANRSLVPDLASLPGYVLLAVALDREWYLVVGTTDTTTLNFKVGLYVTKCFLEHLERFLALQLLGGQLERTVDGFFGNVFLAVKHRFVDEALY